MKHFGLKLAAVFCAVSLWFFVISMKTYQLELDIPLVLANCPANLAISNQAPATVRASLEGKGFDLIRAMKVDSMMGFYLDLSQVELGEKVFPLNRSTFRTKLDKILFLSSAQATITLEIDTKISQNVPVRFNTELRAAKGYLLVGDPVVIPSTIRIAGARKSLTKIFEIPTKNTLIENLSQSDTLLIALAAEGLPIQLPSQYQSVKVAVHVEKRVTKTFDSIPVQLVGPYQRGVHSIEPTRVSVTVSGGKYILSGLKPEDLRLFMEYTRFELEQNPELSPTLVVDKPIESWSTNPSTVQLLTGSPVSP